MRCRRRLVAAVVAWAAWGSAQATELRVALAANSDSDVAEGCRPDLPNVIPFTGNIAIIGDIEQAAEFGKDYKCRRGSQGSVDFVGAEMSLSADDRKAAVYALRFPVRIPRRARIVAANVTFTVMRGGGSELKRSIVGLVDARPLVGLEGKGNNLAQQRGATAAAVAWTGAPPSAPGSTFVTPDLATVVQELVDRDTWQEGEEGALLLLVQLPPAVTPQVRDQSGLPVLFRATKKASEAAANAGLARDAVIPVLRVSFDGMSFDDGAPATETENSAAGAALPLLLAVALVTALLFFVRHRRQQQQQHQCNTMKVAALGEQAKGHQDSAASTVTATEGVDKRVRAALAAAKTSAAAIAAATGRALRQGWQTAKARAAPLVHRNETGNVRDKAVVHYDDDEVIIVSSVKSVRHVATGGLGKDLKPMRNATAVNIENLV